MALEICTTGRHASLALLLIIEFATNAAVSRIVWCVFEAASHVFQDPLGRPCCFTFALFTEERVQDGDQAEFTHP
jgi:hypothetical protein